MPPRSMRPDRVVLAQQEKEAGPARLIGQRRAIARRGWATAEDYVECSAPGWLALALLPGGRCQRSSRAGTSGWWAHKRTEPPKYRAFLWQPAVIQHFRAWFVGHARCMKRPARKKTAVRKAAALVSVERVTQSILVLRGYKVLLDADLAALYGVETRVLLQAVKRNEERFPADFLLKFSPPEWANLRSQIVISSAEHGGRRYPPYAFTEQGVAMLSSVLNSSRAIAVNIQIMRAFVRMRELLASNRELAQKLAELERKIATHDQSITGILKAIRELMNPPPLPKKRGIGFTANFDET